MWFGKRIVLSGPKQPVQTTCSRMKKLILTMTFLFEVEVSSEGAKLNSWKEMQNANQTQYSPLMVELCKEIPSIVTTLIQPNSPALK